MYNFETINSRFTTGSKKWSEIREYLPEEQGDIIPFSVADMELEIAPEIKEGLKKYIDKYVLGYANPTPEFLAAVCKWMQKLHNWTIQPEWILNTPGVVDAFFACVHCYTQPGDGVLLLTPVYYPMYNAINRTGRKLVESPLINKDGRYEIDFADFEAKVKEPNTKLFILCSPHNPCGRVWTKEELAKMAELCNENNVLVISDEIHSDLIMPGYEHVVYAAVSPEARDNCVVCTAPSKTFNLAGLQTSNIIIPNAKLRQTFKNHQMNQANNPKCNVLGYEANRLAYTYCEGWLDQVIALVNKNQQIIREFFKANYPEVVISPLEGTYLLWLDFNGLGIPYMELAEALRKEAKLFFDDGYIFGKQGECFERWNLAGPTRYIEEALVRLDGMLKKRLKK